MLDEQKYLALQPLTLGYLVKQNLSPYFKVSVRVFQFFKFE